MNNKINEFESITHASLETGVYQLGISKVANGKIKHSKGFIWKFK